MGRILKWFLIMMIIVFVGIQFIEVERTNPPVEADLDAPSEVKSILKNSCYDCHSHQTKWPWYSKVAPVSWIIVNHVKEGRERLNFSIWEKYYTSDQRRLKTEILEEILSDKMPLSMYTYTNPNSILNLNQKNIIKDWVENKTFRNK